MEPVRRILGNLSDVDLRGAEIDWVDICWYDAQKKIARLKSRNGREIAFRLENLPKTGLSQGDVLLREEGLIAAINVLPCQTLAMRAKNVAECAKICYEIGNRHAALFYGEDEFEFLTPFENPIKALLDKLGIENSVRSSRLDSSKRISVSMPHAEPKFLVQAASDLKITFGGKIDRR